MPNKFPHMVDESLEQPDPRPVIPTYATTASIVVPEPIGSRRGRKNLRILVEAPPALKTRLYALAFETGLSVAEIGRHALWREVLEAEGNKQKFCERVARERLKHREQEKL